MGVEARGVVISVNVEQQRLVKGKGRLHDLTAGGEHEAVVGDRLGARAGLHGDVAVREVDARRLALDPPDADRAEHIVERDPDVAEIGFVIAHADRVPGIAIDDDDLNIARAGAQFVEPPRRADRRPQARKARPQNQDALQ